MNPDDGFLYLSSPDIEKLKRYYQMLVNKCHLKHLHEPDEILHLVFEKAKKIKDSGRTIYNPYGWSRIAGKHIILMSQRKDIAKNKMCRKLIAQLECEVKHPPGQEVIRDFYLSTLQVGLQELKQFNNEAYELLTLHFFQDLSWKQVAAQLHPETKLDRRLISRVRRAGWRAKEKLKRITFKKLQDETD